MIALSWCLAGVFIFTILSYQRGSLIIWTASFALFLALATHFNGLNIAILSSWIIFLIIFIPLNIKLLRRRFISKPLLNFYRKVMPTMSHTEREAIAAGTVTWEGDLFRGNPNWSKLLKFPAPKLSTEEQAFLDGPVEKLCQMINDWEISFKTRDLSPEMWKFIKEKGFFGLIIPKQYGGKAFSAYAHSQILNKISGRSITVSSTIAVPNSLGPAELLLHYGTPEQKDYYLPKLARGEEMPCFALTSPDAGSDAGAMTDNGIVCWGEYEGERIIGIRLNWDKRYITLAPIATVIGLAFKLYDPDHLIGSKEDIGITCALIPRQTPGITIGRRHFPLDTPFMNGPIHGKDVFIPLDRIIGGVAKAGKGWGMLMECLAAGRAISLPANAMGGAKVLAYATGAYARIRKQFNLSIGRFEGIEEPLAQIGVCTYMMDATRTYAAVSIDLGEKPSVASAIVKYHVTEMGRKVALASMDIHGGKGICLGPKNYLGRGYEAAPIAITVEGANILTRSLIIFGQGAIRCHPYVLGEMEAVHIQDPQKSLVAFDKVVIRHIAFGISNFVRTFTLGITGSLLVSAPVGCTKRYFQHATRFSSALAFIVDVCMLALGGDLKRKESISARLGDILSYLYILSAVLKKYHENDQPKEDFPLVQYAADYCLYTIQERFDDILTNFPIRPFGIVLHAIVFPFGQRFSKPKDHLNHEIAQLLMAPTEARQRLVMGAYLTATKGNNLADVQDALVKTIASEPIEKLIKVANRDKLIKGHTLMEQAQSALNNKVITEEEFDIFMQADAARRKVIAVDDFSNEELTGEVQKQAYSTIYEEYNGTHG